MICLVVCRSLSSWMKIRQGLKFKGGEDERTQSVYTKESELLTKNLSEPLRKHNVVLSHDNLRLLAIMHESLVCVNTLLTKPKLASGRSHCIMLCARCSKSVLLLCSCPVGLV